MMEELKTMTSSAQVEQTLLQAFADPDISLFAEFLYVPQVQELQKTNALLYKTLEVFAYGTLDDLPASVSLSDAALVKLRKLTIVSIVCREDRVPYTYLLEKLHLERVSDLEALIVDCIYTGFIVGKMDGMRQMLLVRDWMARDAPPSEIDNTIKDINDWLIHLRASRSFATTLAKRNEDAEQEKRKVAQDADVAVEVAMKKLTDTLREAHNPRRHKSTPSAASRGFRGLFS